MKERELLSGIITPSWKWISYGLTQIMYIIAQLEVRK